MSDDARSRTRPLLLFDGVCNLCNTAVAFIVKRDARGVIEFASLQSAAARRELDKAGAHQPLPDSLILIDADGVHVRSTAALRIARLLGFPYSLLRPAIIIPRPLRDCMYAFIARNRYRWFGRREQCMAPPADVRERFIDADEQAPAATAEDQRGAR